MYIHCATRVNETHGLLIGGFQFFGTSYKTYYINLKTLDTSYGPELKTERRNLGCATADNRYVIVAGGHDGSNYLRSTEILDLTKPNPSWTCGKKSNFE